MNKAIQVLEKRFNKPVSRDIHLGERGIYHGISHLGKKAFHAIEKGDVVKILAREKGDRVLDVGHRVHVERHRDKERLSLRSLNEKNPDINREKTMHKTVQKALEKDFEIEL